ncbi:hypothetical protein ACFSC3_04380 [Sphingomonas floccifaciens]|uniref:DUF3108 domain-containing protein n=1 Tax=Sphingomonas floccifaciens TaxID=1844115 RepID=A0ABW4NAP4_9SPHN
MKIGLAIAATLGTASAAVAGGPAMTGFHQFAARGDLVEIRKPLWMDGKLRVGSATGTVKRRAMGQERTLASPYTDYSAVARYGRVTFSVTGAEVGGTLSGECSYGRTERRMSDGRVTSSQPVAPLGFTCEFQRDGRPSGRLWLAADLQPERLVQPTVRIGEVEVGGTRLRLRSAHDMGKGKVPVETPIGYWLDDQQGLPVAALDTNGLTRARLALPRDPAQRDAALAAGLAIATFWDPGDTDD